MDQEKQMRQTAITTGIADSLFTEIAEGTLKEGDTVILGIETPEEQAQKKLPPGFEGGPRIR
jgi:HlyD family secretion protein